MRGADGRKVHFRDQKGLGMGIADIYMVESFKNVHPQVAKEGHFNCTCFIFWKLYILIYEVFKFKLI